MSSTVNATNRSGPTATPEPYTARGNNTADTPTPTLHRKTATQTAQADGVVATSARQYAMQMPSPAQDIITQLSTSYTYKANLQVVETQSEMSGTLLDMRA